MSLSDVVSLSERVFVIAGYGSFRKKEKRILVFRYDLRLRIFKIRVYDYDFTIRFTITIPYKV